MVMVPFSMVPCWGGGPWEPRIAPALYEAGPPVGDCTVWNRPGVRGFGGLGWSCSGEAGLEVVTPSLESASGLLARASLARACA